MKLLLQVAGIMGIAVAAMATAWPPLIAAEVLLMMWLAIGSPLDGP